MEFLYVSRKFFVMATLSSETTTRLDCHDQDQVSIFQHPDGGRAYFGLVTRDDGRTCAGFGSCGALRVMLSLQNLFDRPHSSHCYNRGEP